MPPLIVGYGKEPAESRRQCADVVDEDVERTMLSGAVDQLLRSIRYRQIDGDRRDAAACRHGLEVSANVSGTSNDAHAFGCQRLRNC
jgi:hypothetical protein